MKRNLRPQSGQTDPLFAPAGSARNLRKALQLCGQVRDALNRALPDCADPHLQSLYVEEVLPAPDSAHLLVIVGGAGAVEPLEFALAIGKAKARLRVAVAAEITRRRAPDLSFRLNAERGGEEE